MVRKTSSAVPSTGTRQEIEVVYDEYGRAAGSRRVADAGSARRGWSCMTLDARGRTLTVTYSADAGTPARTVTSRYTAGGTTGSPAGDETARVPQNACSVTHSDRCEARAAKESPSCRSGVTP